MFRSMPARLAVMVALVTAFDAGSPALAEPLSDEQRARLVASPEDKPAVELRGISSAAAGRSYLTGNEWNLHLLAPALSGLGGGYIGVGTDQAWLLIGWQRPEIAWLFDYDPLVREVQRVHVAFFRAAPDYDTWRALWEPNANAAAREALAAAWPARDLPVLETIYRRARSRVRKRIDTLKPLLQQAAAKTFITDPETYTWIHTFVGEGRARPMIGDLYGKRGMKGVAATARELGVIVRVVYLSNAEQYFDYLDTFKSNFNALPIDDRSVVVRTLLTWALNKDYRYNTQPIANFSAWLAHPETLRLASMVRLPRDLSPTPEWFHFDTAPPPHDNASRRAPPAPAP